MYNFIFADWSMEVVIICNTRFFRDKLLTGMKKDLLKFMLKGEKSSAKTIGRLISTFAGLRLLTLTNRSKIKIFASFDFPSSLNLLRSVKNIDKFIRILSTTQVRVWYKMKQKVKQIKVDYLISLLDKKTSCHTWHDTCNKKKWIFEKGLAEGRKNDNK